MPSGRRGFLAVWNGKACIVYKTAFLKGKRRNVRKGTSEYLWKYKTFIIYVY